MIQATELPTRPTLEDVQREFEIWRRGRTKRSQIPEELWAEAVKLSSDYTPHQISKALHLNYLALKNRISSTMQDKLLSAEKRAASFIEVDLFKGVSVSECSVEIQKSDGAKMKISFKGGVSVDLMELGKLFLQG